MILLGNAFRLIQSGYILAITGSLVSIIFNLFFWNVNVSAFNGMIVIDNLSILFNLSILISVFLINIISINYTNLEEKSKAEYYSLILFSAIGMNLIAKTSNLVIIFIGLEIFSLSLYILACLGKDKALSQEASLKYFLTGAFTSAIFLYGIALVYGATAELNLNQLKLDSLSGLPMCIVGFILIIAGFLFKVGVVPFHMWIPDTYHGSPTTITAFMSVAVKIAIFVPLIRIFNYYYFQIASYMFTNVFILLAIFTQTIGNILAIHQTNIKRLLAYSSIAHAGYMMLAFLPSRDFNSSSIIFYLVTYIFMNIGIFSIVTLLESNGRLKISDYTGLANKYPLLALSMTVILLSLTGIPVTAGFIAKLYIFSSAIKSGYIFPVIIAVVNSVISAYYYTKIIMLMYTEQSEFFEIKLPFSVLIVLLISVTVILYLGIFPNKFIEFINSI